MLDGARRADARADRGGRFARPGVGNRRHRHGRHLHDEIDPVAQRAGEPAAIARDLHRRAAARAALIALEAAWARVHRGDEDESRREDRRSRGAGDGDAAVLERLPQDLEHTPVELRHLVEEEDAVVGKRDLAGTRDGSAADERDVRHGVVRRAKGPLGQEADARRQGAGYGMNRRALERLVERERRQDARQPPRQHRLAGAGRAAEQQVVSAGRGDLERPAGEELAADVREITVTDPGARRRARGDSRRDPGCRRIVQRVDGIGKCAHQAQVQAGNDGRFGRVLGRHQQALQPEPPGRDGDRQHAPDAIDPAIERQLADDERVVDRRPCQGARGHEQAERDRQVERRPGLADVGGRQVHGDAMLREVEAAIADGGPDAVAALAHGGVGQSDHREVRQPEGDVDLDVDGVGVHAEHRRAAQGGEHGGCALQARARRRRQASAVVSLAFRRPVPGGWQERGRFCDPAAATRAQKMRWSRRRRAIASTARHAGHAGP